MEDEREDADVAALEQVAAILQQASQTERAALRAAVDGALAEEKSHPSPDTHRIRNYEAFIASYLS